MEPPESWLAFSPLCRADRSSHSAVRRFRADSRNLPPLVQRTSVTPRADWLETAVELIDMMVERGGAEEGLKACEQLIRVREGLPSEIYGRAAILAALADRDAATIAKYVDIAESKGFSFASGRGTNYSMQLYASLAKKRSLDNVLNRIAKSAMSSSNPQTHYRAIAALLAVDNQMERSQLFLTAARDASRIEDRNRSQRDAMISLARLER